MTAKLDYEPRKTVSPSRGWTVQGLATAAVILILVALVMGAVWLAYYIAGLA